MSSFPRRSARLSSQHLQQDPYQQRNANLSAPSFANNFSQPSSASTSSRPSPISDGMHPPPSTPQHPEHRLHIQPHFLQQQGQSQFNAPLPSPSGAETGPFFGRSNSQPNSYTSQQAQQGYGDQNTQMGQQGQQYHLHPHSGSVPKDPTLPQSMTPGQLPPDFLAEAAKRAQMACLMRDLGDVSL